MTNQNFSLASQTRSLIFSSELVFCTTRVSLGDSVPASDYKHKMGMNYNGSGFQCLCQILAIKPVCAVPVCVVPVCAVPVCAVPVCAVPVCAVSLQPPGFVVSGGIPYT